MKNINLFYITIFFPLSINSSAFAYSCMVTGLPHVIHHTNNIYPNSGFLIENSILTQILELPDSTVIPYQNLSLNQMPFKIQNYQHNHLTFSFRPFLQDYSWAQPTRPLLHSQSYTLDLSPLLAYSLQPEETHTLTQFPLIIQNNVFNLPKNINNKQIFEFKSSQFADEYSFGYGGSHQMQIDLHSQYNLDDYLLLIHLKNDTKKYETRFIFTDITRHSAHHVTLNFLNDVCGKNLDFFEHEKWQIWVDLISPNGHIIQQSNPAYLFNTSGPESLSFWEKLQHWWQNFKLKWL